MCTITKGGQQLLFHFKLFLRMINDDFKHDKPVVTPKKTCRLGNTCQVPGLDLNVNTQFQNKCCLHHLMYLSNEALLFRKEIKVTKQTKYLCQLAVTSCLKSCKICFITHVEKYTP